MIRLEVIAIIPIMHGGGNLHRLHQNHLIHQMEMSRQRALIPVVGNP